MTNFFPPYVKGLCESFSLFLNSLPIMNYNKTIFWLLPTTVFEAMKKHCDPRSSKHEKLFRDFYFSVILEWLSSDKQSIAFEQFILLMTASIDKAEIKTLDEFSTPWIISSGPEKEFYY